MSEVYAVKPENTLREKIGTDVLIEQILTPEKIKACQDIIDKAHDDIFNEVLLNLADIKAEYLRMNDNLSEAKPHLIKIVNLTFILKGRLEALGLTLGQEVTESLNRFAKNLTNITKEHVLIVSKHLDVLTVILKEKIHGDGGAMGREMLDSLSQLIKKIP